MKRMVVLLVSALLIVLIVLVLFKNKADITEKAKNVPITSYPVSAVKATQENLNEVFTHVGVIVANNDLAVISEQSGKVTEVMVKEGSYVSAGSPLVKLDSLMAEANLTAAQTSYEKAKKDWERNQSLHKDGLISESQLESARLAFKSAEAQHTVAQRQYQNANITSPISGIVSSRPVNIGTMVNPGTVVANVVDTSLFKVKLNLGEQEAFRLRVGDPAEITTDVYPGVTFSGRIDSISVKGDDAHTYPIQIVIPNNNAKKPLKSGMYGKVKFTLPNQNALTIPRTALAGSIQEPEVYVVEAGKARLRPIVVGSEIGSKLTVLEGIQEGDLVVFNGQDNLKDGIAVTVVQ